MHERKYRLALDHLERLVVQRLFELQKGHLESTGYKLRVQISKHLKSRSETIRNALKAYNTAAGNLGRRKLDFQEVIQTAFISDFDLLRDARQDVRQKPWADPAKRVIRDQWFKLQRAKEEVQRLNIEIVRLRTWIRDETQAYDDAIARFKDVDSHLTAELTARSRRQFAINSHIWRYLDTVGGPTLSGIRWFGTSEEMAAKGIVVTTSTVLPSAGSTDPLSDDNDGDDGDGEVSRREHRIDQAAEVMGRLTN